MVVYKLEADAKDFSDQDTKVEFSIISDNSIRISFGGYYSHYIHADTIDSLMCLLQLYRGDR